MELLANPLVVLAMRQGLQPSIDTTTLLYIQQERNLIAVELCSMVLAAGDASALASQAADIAYARGKLDMLTNFLTDAKVSTKIISTEQGEQL